MKLRKQILAVALAVSMAVSCPGAPGIQVTGVKAAGETETQTGGGNVEADGNGSLTTTSGEEGTEEAIKITKMTIANTYYNVGDKFPLYMEFQTEKALTSTELSSLVLTVKDKDNVVAVVTGASINYRNGQCYFQTSEENEYANVTSGEKRSLDFIITDASSKQVGEVTSKAVSFQNKNVWSGRKYLDTGKSYYYINDLNFVFPVTDRKELEAVYLVNQQG